LKEALKDRKEAVDKRFRKLTWSAIVTFVLALLGLADKAIERLSKLIGML
jgi:hypothetical protein